MTWSPTFDTAIGVAGLMASMAGIWFSYRSLKEAELAKKAAQSADTAAQAARDSVRREDRKAKLLTKLTQLLSISDTMWRNPGNLVEEMFEPMQIELRRELSNCANAAAGNYPDIQKRLRNATIFLDDLAESQVGDEDEVQDARKRLIQSIGHTISDIRGELELGAHDHG
ncbi:hypothetical protein [Aquidulcibacter paucihalophilus]|uniref:hypothetical protein n=1 Tax=Aquidulcibacter paucihalophilus TaxID=1978549 RepID=UPI000A191351|nr:hypothetical protein [Aquidulcibacter paucihalophilus]